MGSLNLQLKITSICKSKKTMLGIISFLAYFFFFSSSASAAGCGPTQTFKTTWKTDNPGTSDSNSIDIPTNGGGYSYQVDWNNDTDFSDLDEGTLNTGNVTHDFGAPGTYTIAICGTFPRIWLAGGGDKLKLIDITQWGNNQWASMAGAFSGAENLTGTFTDTADVLNVTNMSFAFYNNDNFNGDIGDWDTSNVLTMQSMFEQASSFNQPIGGWDVSNVTTMASMFRGASSFNQPLNTWDTSGVTTMNAMFFEATSFNEPIASWNVGSVTTMNAMFFNAYDFNQPIGSWDVSSVTNMELMFFNAPSFNQPLNSWDVSSVTNMNGILSGAASFNQPLNNWDITGLSSLDSLFGGATSFNQPLNNWDTSGITSMLGLFTGTAFNQNISNWDVSNVTDFSEMFYKAASFNQPLNSWDMSSATIIRAMFSFASSFNQPLNSWDTSSVTNMSSLFDGAKNFNQDISGWDVSSVEEMTGMFRGAEDFNQDISGWDVSSVLIMNFMFASGIDSQNCTEDDQFDGIGIDTFEEICASSGIPMSFNQDISAWNVSSVTDMTGMFAAGDFRSYEEFDNGTSDTFSYEGIISVPGLINAFNQDLSAWDVTSIFADNEYLGGLRDTFSNTSLSVDNYDAILTAWSGQSLQSDIYFISEGIAYCEAGAARQALIDNFNWTIEDGGQVCGLSTGPTDSSLADTGSGFLLPSLGSLVLITVALVVARNPKAKAYRVLGRR